MRPLAVVLLGEDIEARLLLQDIPRGGLGGLPLQRQMHALVAPVLLRLAGLNAFDLNPQP